MPENSRLIAAGQRAWPGGRACRCRGVFEALDKAEAILGKQRFIAGDRFTEADVRLFVTLIRFDHVYQVG